MRSDIPLPTLRRLPIYYNLFCNSYASGKEYLSSIEVADILGVDHTQVRKDIAMTGYVGKPKVGFEIKSFIEHLKDFLKLRTKKKAVLVGVGNLGIAIAKFSGFKEYGLDFLGLFDADPQKIGLRIGEKEVQSIHSLVDFVKESGAQIAIITVPAHCAQEVTEMLVGTSIKAIWNFAPVHLKVPKEIMVWNQDLMASFLTFSILSIDDPDSAENENQNENTKDELHICMGSACHQLGSHHVLTRLKSLIAKNGLEHRIELKGAFCLGKCSEGIVLKFKGKLITRISMENIEDRFLHEIVPLIQ